MKNILIAAAAAFLFASCTGNTNYTVTGHIDNFPGSKLYVTEYGENGTKLDSCAVVDGSFCYKGMAEEPARIALTASDMREGFRGQKFIYLYADPGCTVNVTADWNDEASSGPIDAEIVGSTTYDEEKELSEQMIALRNDDQDQDLALVNIISDFADAHPDSYALVSYLGTFCTDLPYQEYKMLADKVGEKGRQYSNYKTIVETLAIMEALVPGKPAPDFTRTDINGNELHLSDYKGRVVLLDFWASWCAPCRASMPHVKELAAKYKDLVVICIADNDNTEEKWKDAVSQDGTESFIHVLRGLKIESNGMMDRSDDLDHFYNIHSIPSKVLVDAEGNILLYKATDSQLEKALAELFGE